MWNKNKKPQQMDKQLVAVNLLPLLDLNQRPSD